MLGSVSRLGSGDTLLYDAGDLSCGQPELPYFICVLSFKKAEVNIARYGLLWCNPGLAKDIGCAHYRVLRVRAGFAFKSQRLFEVEGYDRILGELKHEVPQSAD